MRHATDATLVFLIQMGAMLILPALVLIDEMRRIVRRAKVRRRLTSLCK